MLVTVKFHDREFHPIFNFFHCLLFTDYWVYCLQYCGTVPGTVSLKKAPGAAPSPARPSTALAQPLTMPAAPIVQSCLTFVIVR